MIEKGDSVKILKGLFRGRIGTIKEEYVYNGLPTYTVSVPSAKASKEDYIATANINEIKLVSNG